MKVKGKRMCYKHFEKVVANICYTMKVPLDLRLLLSFEPIPHQIRVKCLIILMFLDCTRELPDIRKWRGLQ